MKPFVPAGFLSFDDVIHRSVEAWERSLWRMIAGELGALAPLAISVREMIVASQDYEQAIRGSIPAEPPYELSHLSPDQIQTVELQVSLYESLRDSACERLRVDLHAGRIAAWLIDDDGTVLAIPARFWASTLAETAFKAGRCYASDPVPIDGVPHVGRVLVKAADLKTFLAGQPIANPPAEAVMGEPLAAQRGGSSEGRANNAKMRAVLAALAALHPEGVPTTVGTKPLTRDVIAKAREMTGDTRFEVSERTVREAASRHRQSRSAA